MKVSCPYCKKTTTWEENPWRPFCSERCKMVDLGKWAQEEYRIESPVADESENESAQENS